MINKRLVTFDTLRGFFLILALLEHYFYLSNFLLNEYYRPAFFGSLNLPIIPTDSPLIVEQYSMAMLMKIFASWVSQVYLALATFNLGLKSHLLTKEKMKKNNIGYFFLFLVFTIEKFIIARNIAEILNPNPLQNWMIILMFFNTCSYYLSFKKTISLAITIGVLQFITPINTWINQWEVGLQLLHPEFSLEVRPDIFILAGLIGFLAGIAASKKIEPKRFIYIFCGSMLANVAVNYFTPPYPFDPANVLLFEYDWSYHPLGVISILCTITMVLSMALFLEFKNRGIRLPLLTQIGIDSLWFFAFHRIYFIFFFIPLRFFISQFEAFSPIKNSFNANASAVLIYILLFYGMVILLKYKNQSH